ncbi:MAG: hypothetical protein MZV70_03095 [Desulfobacterales bacterium]|nr:hypothetical protein [Desulfobacterales bacterium]
MALHMFQAAAFFADERCDFCANLKSSQYQIDIIGHQQFARAQQLLRLRAD